jgi:hypothetical protein
MVNYAPNFTPRVRAQYISDGVAHSVLLRAPSGEPFLEADAQALLESWRVAMAAVLGLVGLQAGDNRAAVEILDAEFAQEDEDLFLPFAPTGVEVDVGDDTSGSANPLSKAVLLSLTGKTTQGKGVTLYLWGPRIQAGMGANYSDWRFGTTELLGLAGVMATHFDPTVTDSLAELLAGPDGQPISFFRQRINVRVSASAINAARG